MRHGHSVEAVSVSIRKRGGDAVRELCVMRAERGDTWVVKRRVAVCAPGTRGFPLASVCDGPDPHEMHRCRGHSQIPSGTDFNPQHRMW